MNYVLSTFWGGSHVQSRRPRSRDPCRTVHVRRHDRDLVASDQQSVTNVAFFASCPVAFELLKCAYGVAFPRSHGRTEGAFGARSRA